MTYGPNIKINKYIAYQLSRLEKIKKRNPSMFFNIAWRLMEKSFCFRSAAIHHVCRNWFSCMSVRKINFINNKVTKLVRKGSFELVSKRVYIPKGDTYRPFGVPCLEWRIYLHMYNNFITQFIFDHTTVFYKSVVWKMIFVI